MTLSNSLALKFSALVSFLAFLSCTSPREKAVTAIEKAEQSLFTDSSAVPDVEKALSLYTLYTGFAEQYKQDTLAPEYLFRAADLAQGIRHFRLALNCYDELLKFHPESRKSAAALFMEGFVLQEGLHQPDSAKMKYELFLQKYPDHVLASSAMGMLEQLRSGLTDEELIRSFEQKQDTAAAVN